MSSKVMVLLLISVCLGTVGQYFFKRGMMGHHPQGIFEVAGMLFTPLVFTGLIFYGMATLSWLMVLSSAPLSIAYPSISISYITVVLMSQFIFKEPVSWITWAGVMVIVVGVALVGIGGQQAKAQAQAAPSAAITTSP